MRWKDRRRELESMRRVEEDENEDEVVVGVGEDGGLGSWLGSGLITEQGRRKLLSSGDRVVCVG